MTDDMLDIARRNAPVVADKIGYANVEFKKGRIQDLKLDLDALHEELANRPVASASDYLEMESRADALRASSPMIADNSIDVVVSNCVLNLVDPSLKQTLFKELHRVLKKGGRAVISDIVSDEEVPESMKQNDELWSGCLSGALTETAFLKAFEEAGFFGVRLLKFETEPWRIVEGIEFRSVTVEAYKGKEGPCFERNQAVVYLGPFSEVRDDDGHIYRRGQRYAVCDKTFQLLKKAPYATSFAFLDPLEDIPLEEAKPFDCQGMRLRHPRETKGQDYDATSAEGSSCIDGGAACC